MESEVLSIRCTSMSACMKDRSMFSRQASKLAHQLLHPLFPNQPPYILVETLLLRHERLPCSLLRSHEYRYIGEWYIPEEGRGSPTGDQTQAAANNCFKVRR